MKKILVAGTLMVMMLVAAAWSQQAPGSSGRPGPGWGHHFYDPSKAETVSGDVGQLTEFDGMNGMHKIAGLTLNTGGKSITVHLGPQFYIEKQPVKLAAGDRVEITGVRTTRDGQEIFVAGQVKKGDQVLKLHDETGRALWAGQGPGPAGGQRRPKAAVGC